MKLLSAFLLIIITVCHTTYGHTATQNALRAKMIDELDILKNTFEVRYAPAEWKKIYAGWDLNEQIDIAKAKINSNPNITIKEFQKIVKTFFNTTRDYHVGVHFFSTEAAALPFRIQGDGHGRYFLAWMDKKEVPATWHIGDEVVAFDGMQTDDAVQKIKAEDFGNTGSLTDQGLAETFLTFRIRAIGHQVPQGKTQIAIKHLSEQNSTYSTYPLEWYYNPEAINPGPYKPQAEAQAMALVPKKFTRKKSVFDNPLLNRQMVAFHHEHLEKASTIFHSAEGNDDEDEGFRLIGNRKSVFPSLGKVIWQTKDTDYFQAYLYKAPNNKTVGFIRIPGYMAGEAEVKDFAKIITLFQSKSDALVIDQTNNPGGSVFYMFALASMLSKTPIKLPVERISITQHDVIEAVYFLEELEEAKNQNQLAASNDGKEPKEETLAGYPITPELIDCLERHYKTVISEWEAGRYISNPILFFGIEKLATYPKVQYTKPILLLINHLAFSCGDFFPAMLQDNNRVTTMGTTTAGAGGYVLAHSYPNRFGIAGYSFTGSIAERPDKSPLENLGVTPNIHYEISTTDLQHNYADYVKAINKAVQNLK